MQDLVPHELSPPNAITYIIGGKGKATLVGHHDRFTYRFRSPDTHSCVWVSVLTGSDNESDYKYIGFIPTRDGQVPQMVAGQKGSPDAPSFKALAWYLNKAFKNPDAAEQATFVHEGICGKCGRALTVPESIERGIGPTCWGSMT